MNNEYEDIECSEAFKVESFEDFYNENIESDYDEYIMRKYLKPCKNCGELVNKNHLYNGLCNLCCKSEIAENHRGTTVNASRNLHFIEDLIENKWDIK